MTSQVRVVDPDAGVWEAETEIKMPGGARLPARMTVLRTGNGLLLYSPIPIDDELGRELADLGRVKAIVAPSLYHHLYARPAAERYPEARVYGPPGLAAKRPKLRIDTELDGSEQPFDDDVEVAMLGGAPKINELILLHRPSRTLICCDLVFNIRRWNFQMGLVLRIFGTRGRFACSRLIAMLIKDKAAARSSLEPIYGWDFDRVIMAHGEIYQGDDAPRVLAGAISERLGV